MTQSLHPTTYYKSNISDLVRMLRNTLFKHVSKTRIMEIPAIDYVGSKCSATPFYFTKMDSWSNEPVFETSYKDHQGDPIEVYVARYNRLYSIYESQDPILNAILTIFSKDSKGTSAVELLYQTKNAILTELVSVVIERLRLEHGIEISTR